MQQVDETISKDSARQNAHVKIEDELELGNLCERERTNTVTNTIDSGSVDYGDEARKMVVMKRKGISMDSNMKSGKPSRQPVMMAFNTTS